ncbi:MAG: response regulator, partial [Chloroflexota bacterium]|nr:response regulator [Chloroflexota bacterium]
MTPLRPRILVVDDEQGVLLTLQEVLLQAGYLVDAACSGEEALAAIGRQEIDLLLTDLRIGDFDGMSLLAAARKHDPETVAVLLTGYASLESAIQALRNGAFAYLLKPCNLDELKLTIERGLEKKRLAEALRQRVTELEEANARIRSFSAELEDKVRLATSQLASRVQELQASRARLNTIIDSMSDGLIVYDDEHRVVLANAYLRSLFGLPSVQLTGQTAEAVQELTGEPPLDEGQINVDAVTSRLIKSLEFELDQPPHRAVRRLITAIPG